MLIALSALLAGSQGAYTVVKNWSPTSMDCAEYLRERPNKEWLHLENCSLNFMESTYNKTITSRTSFSFNQVYVPVRSPDSTGDEPVTMVLASHERRHMEIVADLIELGDDKSKVLEYVVENHDRLVVEEDVQGLARFGIDVDSEDEEKLRALVDNLDEDFVILDSGKAPRRAFTVFALSLGVLAGALSLLLMSRE